MYVCMHANSKIEVALICDQDLRGSDSNVVAYKEERFIYVCQWLASYMLIMRFFPLAEF